jgi:hypothetical protein
VARGSNLHREPSLLTLHSAERSDARRIQAAQAQTTPRQTLAPFLKRLPVTGLARAPNSYSTIINTKGNLSVRPIFMDFGIKIH